MSDKIPASIEISPKQALESPDLPGLFPAQTRVYITDVGTDTNETLVNAAKRVTDLGYRAVPHFASRRIPSKKLLEERIKAMANDAGVQDVLVIGGGLEKPAGEIEEAMHVLNTGFFDQNGIKHIGIAGHPEGSPDFNEEVAIKALQLKQDFAQRSDSELRIVTQFGFDADKFIKWAEGLSQHGITLPVHIGVAGPAKITTLIKFAAMCGVGNSLNFLKKRGSAITTMALGFDPDEIVNPIENHTLNSNNPTIHQIHVFPFGGMKKSAEWLKSRGSW